MPARACRTCGRSVRTLQPGNGMHPIQQRMRGLQVWLNRHSGVDPLRSRVTDPVPCFRQPTVLFESWQTGALAQGQCTGMGRAQPTAGATGCWPVRLDGDIAPDLLRLAHLQPGTAPRLAAATHAQDALGPRDQRV